MGNTAGHLGDLLGCPVHPHTHGEHVGANGDPDAAAGSSPHAWGTHRRADGQDRRRRFIPTRMGNTATCSSWMSSRTVHPHTHGEHAALLSRIVSKHGSSPHAWGTRADLLVEVGVGRFIPTRMGNTPGARHTSVQPPVHPHTHGEHGSLWVTRWTFSGSSPHAWGTRRAAHED